MAHFTITSGDEFSGVTVIFPDGSTQTMTSDNKNYSEVVRGLIEGDLTDDELLDLIAPFEAIYKKLTKLSERVARKGSKLLFDGDVVNNALSKFIIDLMDSENNEAGWRAYVAFMEKLYTNPSETSREHLFHFIDANGLQVTPDGDIVLYKGTEEDGHSSRAGYGIVNGEEVENGKLLNSLGAVIEIPRAMVDADRSQLCSVGLHVGAYEYVRGTYRDQWPRLWTVLVNPRDVVAVPHDFKSSKIRVTRYVVVEDNTAKVKHEGVVWEPVAIPAPEVKPVEVSVAEPEVKPVTVTIDTSAKKVAIPAGSRVAEYEKLIKSGGAGKNLKRFRNKSVTAGRRTEFDQAVANLGLTY